MTVLRNKIGYSNFTASQQLAGDRGAARHGGMKEARLVEGSHNQSRSHRCQVTYWTPWSSGYLARFPVNSRWRRQGGIVPPAAIPIPSAWAAQPALYSARLPLPAVVVVAPDLLCRPSHSPPLAHTTTHIFCPYSIALCRRRHFWPSLAMLGLVILLRRLALIILLRRLRNEGRHRFSCVPLEHF